MIINNNNHKVYQKHEYKHIFTDILNEHTFRFKKRPTINVRSTS